MRTYLTLSHHRHCRRRWIAEDKPFLEPEDPVVGVVEGEEREGAWEALRALVARKQPDAADWDGQTVVGNRDWPTGCAPQSQAFADPGPLPDVFLSSSRPEVRLGPSISCCSPPESEQRNGLDDDSRHHRRTQQAGR